MHAMILAAPGAELTMQERPEPAPGAGEVRVKVSACGVCRTDLHVVDGELPDIRYPIVPGHEVVGRIDAVGRDVADLAPGMRVGVPWLGWTCGHCAYCESGRENLCDRPQFTGYTRDGGFATHLVACALLLSSRRGRRRYLARAPAVRRPDRLALAGDGG